MYLIGRGGFGGGGVGRAIQFTLDAAVVGNAYFAGSNNLTKA
jgi:hypothetical protein